MDATSTAAERDVPRPPIKIITLRRNGRCACGAMIPAASRAGWNRVARTVTCLPCLQGVEPAARQQPVVETGVAGGSLQREFERRSTARAGRIRAAHPHIGGLMLALSDEPQTTRAFQVGAAGERTAAARIMKRAGTDVRFLLNRSLGAGRRDGDVDLVAIGPGGVFIVDVKNYPGADISVRRSGGLFRPRREQLLVGRRDRTALLDSLRRQVTAVQTALAGGPDGAGVTVTAAFCFLEGLPLVRTLSVDGFALLGLRGAATLVASPGSLGPAVRDRVHAQLARALPSAV